MPAPDSATFDRLAHAAMARLPDAFLTHLAGVIVRIEEFADAETLHSVGLEDRWDLTGLYHGRPLGEQSIWTSGELPPMITLYRQPLIAEWRATGVELEDLVMHVIVHEVGHHFGLSDDDMDAIENDVS